MNEIITNWLEGFSQDFLGPGAGWAVFPQGQRVLASRQNILGATEKRMRLSFRILCHSALPAAPVLEAFARRAEAEAPLLGAEQTVRVEDARLTAKDQNGMGRYECKLIFEFTI